MNWSCFDVDISSDKLHVRSLKKNDFETIAHAINDPDGHFAEVFDLKKPQAIMGFLGKVLASQEQGLCNPVVFWAGDEVAGISRYHSFDQRRRSLEIGVTWIAPKWQRTFVNTHAKYLMMTYAFDTMAAERIVYLVNQKNYISQMAVLRMGVNYEGVIHRAFCNHRQEWAEGFVYSVTRPEWSQAKERLEMLMANQVPPSKYFPSVWESPRLALKSYKITDAEKFLTLLDENRLEFAPDFYSARTVRSLQDARAHIAQIAHLWAEGKSFSWGIYKGSDLVGQIQLKNLDWRLKSAEFGYFIDHRYRHQGYTKECLNLVIDELMNVRKFNRLFVRIRPDNGASLALARSLGFKAEGLLRNAHLNEKDNAVNVVLYSFTND